jgi:hypothetical protein
MTSKPLNDDPQNDRTPDPSHAKTAAGRRPDQGGAPPGRDQAEPATGGQGAAGAGGSGGFGT